MNMRKLSIIAGDVREHWPDVWFGAEPYLQAMSQLDSITDTFGCDKGSTIVAYFLANAQTWRGEHARRIKAELNAMLKSFAR